MWKSLKENKTIYTIRKNRLLQRGKGPTRASIGNARENKPKKKKKNLAKIIVLFHFAFCVNLAQRTTEQESFIFTDSLMMNESIYSLLFFWIVRCANFALISKFGTETQKQNGIKTVANAEWLGTMNEKICGLLTASGTRKVRVIKNVVIIQWSNGGFFSDL